MNQTSYPFDRMAKYSAAPKVSLKDETSFFLESTERLGVQVSFFSIRKTVPRAHRLMSWMFGFFGFERERLGVPKNKGALRRKNSGGRCRKFLAITF